MSKEDPADKAMGKKNQLIEKLHEQFDPGEKIPVDPKDTGPQRSQKQPGQELQDPEEFDALNPKKRGPSGRKAAPGPDNA